ncbi:MAG: hypothetical protein ACXVA9_04710 [Bdellovibrionales bacterium]
MRFAPVEGQYEAKGEFQYLTTSANYPSGGGSSSSLLFGGKLTRMLGVAEVTYDFSPAIRFWGGFSGGQTTTDNYNAAASVFSTVMQTKTLSGMSEGWLGGQWWTEYQKLDIVPQVDFVFPFSRANTNSPDPLLGEGAIRFQAGSWVMLPMNEFTPFGYLGFAYRDEGRSSLLPYNAGLRFGHPETWWIQAEVRGFQSITDDSNSGNRAVRDAYLINVDGGSYEFDAINPSRTDIAAMAGARFNQIGIYGGFSKSLVGRNSADDWEIRAGFTFTGAIFAKAKRSDVPDGFSAPQEKYDDTIFQNDVVPEPYIEDPVVTPAPKTAPLRNPTPATKNHAKPKKPVPDAPMPNVEMLMKDTQKSLEKKKAN